MSGRMSESNSQRGDSFLLCFSTCRLCLSKPATAGSGVGRVLRECVEAFEKWEPI